MQLSPQFIRPFLITQLFISGEFWCLLMSGFVITCHTSDMFHIFDSFAPLGGHELIGHYLSKLKRKKKPAWYYLHEPTSTICNTNSCVFVCIDILTWTIILTGTRLLSNRWSSAVCRQQQMQIVVSSIGSCIFFTKLSIELRWRLNEFILKSNKNWLWTIPRIAIFSVGKLFPLLRYTQCRHKVNTYIYIFLWFRVKTLEYKIDGFWTRK